MIPIERELQLTTERFLSLIEPTRKNAVMLFLERGTYSTSEKTWIVIPKAD